MGNHQYQTPQLSLSAASKMVAKFMFFHFRPSLTVLLLVSSMFHFHGLCNAEDQASYNPKTTALFIFGDSTADPGNNRYISTTSRKRSYYKPYGQNGFFSSPTGRFSDGRVFVDFIAAYARLPLIPPFLQPSADFTSGVNFASGGAGVLPETNQGQGIDLPTQLKNFEVVQRSLARQLGEFEARKTISEAVYFFSIGSNDYMGGYLGSSELQELYRRQDYVAMVVGNMTRSIQVLYKKGARKFGFLSLCPLGCLPALRAANPMPNANGACYEEANLLALEHNQALLGVLTNLEQRLKGFKYSSNQFYNWIQDRITNPSKHGFKNGINACCGSGPFRGIYSCGDTKNSTKLYDLCDNTGDYIWWDSYHPTEKLNEQLAKDIWDGPASFVGPFSLKNLFSSQMT